MQRVFSLDRINDIEKESHVNIRCYCNSPDQTRPRKRLKASVRSLYTNFCITIKPKIPRSSSLSDLTCVTSDLIFPVSDFLKQTTFNNSFDLTSGDTLSDNCDSLLSQPYMPWNSKGKRAKKKPVMSPETYAAKFANEFVQNQQATLYSPNTSSAENSSMCSLQPKNLQGGASFPFKETPSGNLKVQSNQVVFQSSTVGVLLADPTQAKVKVKFEGKAAGETEETSPEFNMQQGAEPLLQYGAREPGTQLQTSTADKSKGRAPGQHEDRGKGLGSLGYALPDPVDWLRVQLPKKLDLFQEFFRRIHNYVNTDTIVKIGNEEFHCHHMVLQVYSSFFDTNPQREIEIPASRVSPVCFQTIYEWMIFSGPESNKVLKRDNILDLFNAAQYLAIKDLEDQCWAFIVSENLFTEDTAFALYREARSKGMTPVMDLMVSRVMRFFLPLVASKDFLELEPEEVMTFLKSNYICVTSEIEVLMAAVRWLYGEWPTRRRFAVDAMRCVRFGLISPWQLVDIKRNPDNSEILDVVNEPEVQQMVDDGLAYVIIKYWYGNSSKNYYHWIDVLGLSEPAERNWIGEEKNHVTYKDFLKYLEQFMIPKDQMYQQMAMMQPPRRSDDIPAGSLRTAENDMMEMRRHKMDFPLPATLKGLSGEKDKSFPTMSEFFENRRKVNEGSPPPNRSSPSKRSPTPEEMAMHSRRASPENRKHSSSPEPGPVEPAEDPPSCRCDGKLFASNHRSRKPMHQVHLYAATDAAATRVGLTDTFKSPLARHQIFEPPEKDASDINTTNSDGSSCTLGNSINDMEQFQNYQASHGERRHSIAATYLATATAGLAGTSHAVEGPHRAATTSESSRPPGFLKPKVTAASASAVEFSSPQISLFNQSKEFVARANMNRLSNCVLGPTNKNYISDGSLFNWDRETVLVFGGIDPHTPYGIGKNMGKDIFRFDPVTNVWDYVGDLPEPRHHHSVAFLRGRVYLVGGADPRDDDIRGKSVVVSTVWSYEPVTRAWFSESGLSIPRKNFGLVVHHMALYAIGGQDKKGRVLRSVEKFDPKSGTWSDVRSMGVARMAVAATKYREYIWVAGGMTGEKKKPLSRLVECYDSKTNQWTEIYSLRFPRCFANLFSMNDKLYLVGGAGMVCEKDKTASSVGAIDVWDFKERAWLPQTEMSIPRHGHALAYLGTQLIIIGGVTTIYMRALSNVESFCCERNAWIRGVAGLPSPISGHGAVTLPPASLM